MSPRDLRSSTDRRAAAGSLASYVAGILRRAGLAAGDGRPERFTGLEALENRVLLAGDHPSFTDVFNNPDAVEATLLEPNGAGEDSSAGEITPAGDDDMFRFTAPVSEFVTIWADAINTASGLDSRIVIYRRNDDGSLNDPVLVGASSSNGTTTGGTNTDGWFGFLAEAGTEYFIRVQSDTMSGAGSVGDYVVRLDARPTAFATLDGDGVGSVSGSISQAGDDIVYKLTAGSSDIFDSVATLTGMADATDLDVRVDLYDATGALIRGDSQSGFQSDAFLAWKADPSAVYYIRVRGDQFDAGNPLATGAFDVDVDAAAEGVPVDPVTRLGTAGSSAGNTLSVLYRFEAQGTGLSILTVTPAGFIPIPDAAIHLYNDAGQEIAFNDDLLGTTPQIEAQLLGGETYYVVVEDFDDVGGGGFQLAIETNHTVPPTTTNDDHADADEFDLATPVAWGDPQSMPDYLNGGTLGDRNQIVVATGTGRIHDFGDSDLFVFTPPVDMLSQYEGKQTQPDDPEELPEWRPDRRPGTRLQILVLGEHEGLLTTPTITVFDSNFAQVFGPNSGVYTPGTEMPPHPEGAASGMWDPASYQPDMTLEGYPAWIPAAGAEGIQVWGGEAYYLQITGSPKGRYRFVIMADALPSDAQGAGEYNDNNSQVNEVPGAGEWTDAPEIIIGNATGDAAITGGISGTFDSATGLSTFFERAYAFGDFNLNNLAPGFNPTAAGPNGGLVILQESGLAGIESVEDTDLFLFTAPADGTAEIRINTTQLADFYNEFITNTEPDNPDDPGDEPLDPPETPLGATGALSEKVYNSLLDSALRIFNFDRQEIAFNDENAGMAGQTEETTVGGETRTFHKRDARVTFNVRQGERYFIQVESGQREAFLAGLLDQIDWRGVLGSYEVLINTMPDLDFQDDHVNAGLITNPQATVLAVNETLGDAANGTGSVDGRIDDNSFNPTDTDLFTYISPGEGAATFTVQPTGASALAPDVTVFNADGQTITFAAAAPGQPATVSVSATQGERLFIRVDGAGGSEGTYILDISGNPFVDDHGSLPDFEGFTDLAVLDFLGSAQADGVIDYTGDSDIFRFEANDFASIVGPNGDGLIQLTIETTSGALRPVVRVYEVGFDRTEDAFPTGADGQTHPILLEIGSDTVGDDGTAQTSFSITAPPRQSFLSDQSSNTYNYYYVVVSGADPDTDKGGYELTLENFTANDDHADDGQFDLVGFDTDGDIPLASDSGDGDSSGEIEISGDTDLLRFTALATGRSRISVTSTSSLLLSVKIYRQTGVDGTGAPIVEPVADVTTGEFTRNAPDTADSTARFTIDAVRDGIYFVLVSGRSGGTVKTSDTGAYTINANTPAGDDHPNEGEWAIATPITLSPFTGDGVETGIITQDFGIDTDLFTFTSLVSDNMSITVDTPSSGFEVTMRLFRSDFTEIGSEVVDNGEGDQDPNEGRIRRRVSTDGAGEQYFILISAASPAFLPGTYTLSVNGAASNPTDDDHPDAGEWDQASRISDENGLSRFTGDGEIDGSIDDPTDTDLFFFTSLAGSPDRPHKAFVQVVAPDGSPLNVAMTVYNADGTPVSGQASQIPGVKANFTFDITGPNQKYFILVDDAAGATGGYTVKVDTAPETFYLYYPEGFATSTIREYVTVANPNDFDVNYTIKIRYANEALGEVVLVDNATLAAGRRGGITISNGPDGRAPGVVAGRAYAIIVESDGPMGATLSHYDFGASLGESFTSTTSTIWSFARGQRFPGEVEDFLVFYNPNATTATVTVTAYRGGEAVATLTTTVAGMRRGGFSFDDETTLPLGEFAFTVTSAPADPDDEHIGIVASLSHYDTANTTGYALLGEPSSGSTEGVIPGLTHSSNRTAEVTFFNPNATPAVVTIRGSYIGADLPDLERVLVIPALSSLTFTGEQLAIVEDQPIGIRYSSAAPIVALGSERLGQADADATSPNTQLATGYFFGDAFINSSSAGTLYLETLTFYNPGNTGLGVDVELIYFDGTVVERTVTVAGDSFASLDLHALQEILDRGGNNFFSIQVSAPRPFAAVMTHYDLFLGGGWTTSGAPFGLQNPLSQLS